MARRFALSFCIACAVPAAAAAPPAAAPKPQEGTPVKLTSPAFAPGAAIPSQFTCDGANISPALAWTEPPPGTKSLALVVTDPDAPDPKAPRTVWTHWILYDLPADARSLREAVSRPGLPQGTREGTNDFGKTGWGGPCPPIGRHRYPFTLYALDAMLGDLGKPGRAALERAMAGHVLAKAEIVGTYQKQ